MNPISTPTRNHQPNPVKSFADLLQQSDFQSTMYSQIRELCPHCFENGHLNLDTFESWLETVMESPKDSAVSPTSYTNNWKGKQQSIETLLSPAQMCFSPLEGGSLPSSPHLLIEGDNLEALKLLYNSYREQVDLIYLDPPYNTGKNFVYRDRFQETLEEYSPSATRLVLNSEFEGRYHSNWMSMMYPRLILAHQFLCASGVLIISIGDHEVHNLRLMCDEIFGEPNFAGTIIWNSTKSVTNTALISVSHTYNLVYIKDRQAYAQANSDHIPNLLSDGTSSDHRPSPANLLWDSVATTTNATSALKKLMGGRIFDNPKPVELIQKFIRLATANPQALILDFFAGSGTTAEAVLRLNHAEGTNHRVFLVQLDEATPEKSLARQHGYNTISQITRSRINLVQQALDAKSPNYAIQTNQIHDFCHFTLVPSVHRQSQNTPSNEIREGDTLAALYEILLKFGLPLPINLRKSRFRDQDVFLLQDDAAQRVLLISFEKHFDSVVNDVLAQITSDTVILVLSKGGFAPDLVSTLQNHSNHVEMWEY